VLLTLNCQIAVFSKLDQTTIFLKLFRIRFWRFSDSSMLSSFTRTLSLKNVNGMPQAWCILCLTIFLIFCPECPLVCISWTNLKTYLCIRRLRDRWLFISATNVARSKISCQRPFDFLRLISCPLCQVHPEAEECGGQGDGEESGYQPGGPGRQVSLPPPTSRWFTNVLRTQQMKLDF
jgi:hypothetical protein